MADEPSDQPTATAAVVNGVHVQMTGAQLKATVNSATHTVYRFTHGFEHYRSGRSYALDAVTKARLLAASAPMVAA